MKIDKRLNIVLAAPQGEGVAYVHSVPIARETYEANHRLLTRTMVRMVTDDLGMGTMTRVALLNLRDVAREMDGPRGDAFSQAAESLILEIRRLSNVRLQGERGWENITLDEAFTKKMLGDDALSEVLNALVFFTLASWFYRRKEREMMYEILKGYDAQIVSSSFTEFQTSLPTLMPGENTGEKLTTPSSLAV